MGVEAHPSLSPAERSFQASRQEYQVHLPLIERVQAGLKEDVVECQVQEGWDLLVQEGIAAWVEDRDSIFRFLRRNSYDEDKTRQVLRASISNRITHSLHTVIPSIVPYSGSPLLYILPPDRYTDRVGRPIVVFTFREVIRDENGKLDDLGQWVWWTSELLRRTLRDYWVEGRWNKSGQSGQGGEGCVAIIDATGSGYRNIEVELLPTLGAVGPKNFPGMVDSAYIVNAGWAQRSLWRVMRRLLPQSTIDKIRFLDGPEDADKFFDLDRLPQAYGGRDPYVFDPLNNPVLEHYQATPLSTVLGQAGAASFASTADALHAANSNPPTCRVPSRGVNEPRITTGERTKKIEGYKHASYGSIGLLSREEEDIESTASSFDRASRIPPSLTPMQRVKSLADFHLYLSPSRLAQVDLLSDSSDGGARPLFKAQASRPASSRPNAASLISRPCLRSHDFPSLLASEGPVRSYSDRLQQHHAERLERLEGRLQPPPPIQVELQAGEDLPGPDSEMRPPEPLLRPESSRLISAFSRSRNPWFGYPATLIPDLSRPGTVVIRPRYSRKRKRDLAKTLLFLFMLRLQSWRDAIERALGHTRWRALADEPKTPGAGLTMSERTRPRLILRTEMKRSNGGNRDWIWMMVGFLLVRGSWMRLIVTPLKAIGLEPVRHLSGLL